jgi:23S rRNA-/tRNA-specific pseudouridylate synthase
MTPEQMVSRLLYRDGLMLVIDKPAGLALRALGSEKCGSASPR